MAPLNLRTFFLRCRLQHATKASAAHIYSALIGPQHGIFRTSAEGDATRFILGCCPCEVALRHVTCPVMGMPAPQE
eukprot:4954359-Amphidinium_carterae.1